AVEVREAAAEAEVERNAILAIGRARRGVLDLTVRARAALTMQPDGALVVRLARIAELAVAAGRAVVRTMRPGHARGAVFAALFGGHPARQRRWRLGAAVDHADALWRLGG